MLSLGRESAAVGGSSGCFGAPGGKTLSFCAGEGVPVNNSVSIGGPIGTFLTDVLFVNVSGVNDCRPK